VRVKSFFALVGVVAIPVTIILVSGRNPLPWLAGHVAGVRGLSDPPTAWQLQVGNTPQWAAAAGTSTLVLGGDQLVTAVNPDNGDKRWQQAAQWAAVAGGSGGGAAVVVLGGVVPDHGDPRPLEVVDAASGSVLWPNTGDVDVDAAAAWTFTDLVLTLTCPKSKECVLVAHQPHAARGEQWRLKLPAAARTLRGANPTLAGLRTQLTGALGPAPPVLGFPVADQVYLVDPARGRLLASPASSPTSRVLAAGSGQLRVGTELVNGACRFTLQWSDLTGRGGGWSRNQYQPATGDGASCESRGQPAGDGGLLSVLGPGRRSTLLDVRTGEVVFSSADDERILAAASSGGRASVALVRSAGKDTVTARSLSTGAALWRQPVNEHTLVGTDGAVVTFLAPESGELTARGLPGGETKIHANTLAVLLGYAPAGLVLDETLKVGLLRYGSIGTASPVHP
jgi:outer membrane protein assembly factor BamB